MKVENFLEFCNVVCVKFKKLIVWVKNGPFVGVQREGKFKTFLNGLEVTSEPVSFIIMNPESVEGGQCVKDVLFVISGDQGVDRRLNGADGFEFFVFSTFHFFVF